MTTAFHRYDDGGTTFNANGGDVNGTTGEQQMTHDENSAELKKAQDHYLSIISRIGCRWSKEQHSSFTFVNQEQFDLRDIERVLCYIHTSSNSCKIGINRLTGDIYHIIDVQMVYMYGAQFNARTESKEYWEKFTKNYIAPIMNSDRRTDFSYYVKLLDIFSQLDALDITVINAKAQDFLKKHIITDGLGNLYLCNRHLLKRCPKIESADQVKATPVYNEDSVVRTRILAQATNKEPQVKYMHPTFRKTILQLLFPTLLVRKASTTTTQIPSWVYTELNSLSNSINYYNNIKKQNGILNNKNQTQLQQNQKQQQPLRTTGNVFKPIIIENRYTPY